MKSFWNGIESAPKNPEGTGVGPWILVFSEWDHAVYTARWECKGDSCGWKIKGRNSGPWSSLGNIKYWAEMPQKPWVIRLPYGEAAS